MFLWQKFAEPEWVKAHEDHLQAHAPGQLVIVRRPARKRLQLEITCRRRCEASALLNGFGGRIEVLPSNWRERFARPDSKPIKIGKRLVISNMEETLISRTSRHKHRAQIIIPAALAFGTGEDATTAMSLRFLEQLTRGWNPGWSWWILELAAEFLFWPQNVSVPAASSESTMTLQRFPWPNQTPD